MPSGQRQIANTALHDAVQESGKHPSDLVRGITTERTLDRWITDPKARPDPFKARQIAKRLKRPYEEVFGG